MTELILRLLLSAGLGAAVGVERELHGRAAGIRTNLAVCLGTSLIMIVSENYYLSLGPLSSDIVRVDPGRIASGALAGVGFIGAGTILKSGSAIRGLTTAASIWVMAAVGLAAGGGHLALASVTTAILLVGLIALRRVEQGMHPFVYKTLVLTLSEGVDAEALLLDHLARYRLQAVEIDHDHDRSRGLRQLTCVVRMRGRDPFGRVVDELAQQEGVLRVRTESFASGSDRTS